MSAGLRFVGVAAALTLFVGVLASVGLVAPSGDPAAPAAAPAANDVPTFPTGTFVATDRSNLYLEFNEDGTGRVFLYPGTFQVNTVYAVVGDLWTEMTVDSPLDSDRLVPATYYWDYDGELLTFEPWGEEVNPGTRGATMAHSYRAVPGERLGFVARVDIPAGEVVKAWAVTRSLVDEARIVPGAFLTINDAIGRVAASPIEEGELLTADLFESAE